jgi:hypothetical protein
LASVRLAKKMLPWFGVEWPSWREFLHGITKSFSVSVASAVYFGLQQLEALTFGLAAGAVTLARLVLTVVGVQCLDILVRSFIKTGAYAMAPFIRDRRTERISALREEAHGNIIFLFAIAGPVIVGITPLIVPIWISGAVLLSPWVAAAILLLAMFRLLVQFDAGLLDQARDFQWKNAAAALVVFVPTATVALFVAQGNPPEGWYWLLTAVMGSYFAVVAWRCKRILALSTAWSPLAIPVVGALVTAFINSNVTAAGWTGARGMMGTAAGVSVASGLISMLHPRLSGPVRKLATRFIGVVRRTP